MGATEPLLDPVMATSSKEFNVLTRNDTIPDAARRRAVDLIVDTLLQSRQKITVVAIGPLTNIALALKADPRIKNSIERIVVMGGAYFTSDSDYNFKLDRAAAQIVFQWRPHHGSRSRRDVARQAARKGSDQLRLATDPVGRSRPIAGFGRRRDPRTPSEHITILRCRDFRPDLIDFSWHDQYSALGRSCCIGDGIQHKKELKSERRSFPGPVHGTHV
jgi:hypothetical protein